MATDWHSIPGWPYSVSPEGHIRNDRTGHILRPGHDAYGYKKVKLRDTGRLWQVHVHRLVALAFLGPAPSDRHRVHLKDGMKHHPHLANLEWRVPRAFGQRLPGRKPNPRRKQRPRWTGMSRDEAMAAHDQMVEKMRVKNDPAWKSLYMIRAVVK